MKELIKSRLSDVGNFTECKLDDAVKMCNYLLRQPLAATDVECMKKNYGGEALRVYSLLFELEQSGIVEISQRGLFGEPLKCKLTNPNIFK